MPTENSDEDGTTNGTGFIRTVLSDLFETIADMDERNRRQRSETGSARRGTTQFDYGFTVGIGPQADAERETKTQPAMATTVHETDGGWVVTLDLPGIDPRELSAGVNGSEEVLLIAVEDGVIERVPLPRGDLEVRDGSFNNGVLDVRLTEADE